MRWSFAVLSIAALLVGGCGAGAVRVVESDAPIPPPTSNGLEYAEPGDALPGLTGNTLDVQLVRFETDYETGVTRILSGSEEVTLALVDVFGPTGDFTISLDGQTLAFTGGSAVDQAGRRWTAVRNTFGGVSATTGVFSYSYGAGAGAIDSEGIIVVGFETDPDTLSRMDGTARYDGTWFGFGAMVDGAGRLVQTEVEGGGLVSLVTDFARSEVSGAVTGSFVGFGDVSSDLPDTTILSGAFSGNLSGTCAGESGCRSDSTVSGRFFGAEAEDISGVILFEEVRTIDGETRTLLAPAGFTAEQDTHIAN